MTKIYIYIKDGTYSFKKDYPTLSLMTNQK